MSRAIPHATGRWGPALGLCFAGLAVLAAARAPADEVQVGRYSALRAAPTAAQSHLLATLVTVRFPASVTTVGEAVQHLLARSGYRLADEVAADPARVGLFQLPLPAVHRALGPMSLQSALETLAGPAFRLVEDPVHRLLSFERCAVSRTAPSAGGPPEVGPGEGRDDG